MVSAMGIIAMEGDNVKIEGVMNYRPIHTVSFLGRYKFIDFPISNLSNSGIDKIHIYIKTKPMTVFEHIGTGRHYNIKSKQGRIRVMYGEKEITSSIYNTDVQSYLQNIEYISAENAEYVVVLPSHLIYTQDLRKVIDKHIETNADITMLYKDTNDASKRFFGCDCMNMIKGNRVIEITTNMGKNDKRAISMESYVMKKSLFLDLLKKSNDISPIYWFKDIVNENLSSLDVRGYEISSRALANMDLKSYFDNSMHMLKVYDLDLFTDEWEIYTKTSDSPPSVYGNRASVSNSLVANGSVIDGKITNCIIGRDVEIEEGAELEECIVMSHCHIGKGKKLRRAVIDKNVRIEKIDKLIPKGDDIIYVNKNDNI